MARVEQEYAKLDLRFSRGDSFVFRVTFPFVISVSDIEAKISDVDFTLSQINSYCIALSLTPTQTEDLKGGNWYLKATTSGLTRTYLRGFYQSI